MQFKKRRAPGRRDEEVHVSVRQNRQNGCKGCDRTKNAWLATEIALGYKEGKGNGFNCKKHKQEAAVKDIYKCSAALNLLEISLKNTNDFAGEAGEGVGILSSITHTIKPSRSKYCCFSHCGASTIQKCFLLADNTLNIPMLSPTFKYISPDLSIGFSKFASLTSVFFAGILKIYDHS